MCLFVVACFLCCFRLSRECVCLLLLVFFVASVCHVSVFVVACFHCCFVCHVSVFVVASVCHVSVFVCCCLFLLLFRLSRECVCLLLLVFIVVSFVT